MERGPLRVLRPDEIAIVRIEPDQWETMRDLRLALLADAPNAFGSTLAREQDFEESDWRGRFRTSVNFVARSGGTAVGIAAGLPDEDNREEVQLVSMWVHPEWRRLRLGARLTTAVIEWARSSGFRAVHLWVAIENEAAEQAYAQQGFTRTGAAASIRPDEPWRLALEMRREL